MALIQNCIGYISYRTTKDRDFKMESESGTETGLSYLGLGKLGGENLGGARNANTAGSSNNSSRNII